MAAYESKQSLEALSAYIQGIHALHKNLLTQELASILLTVKQHNQFKRGHMWLFSFHLQLLSPISILAHMVLKSTLIKFYSMA